MIGKIDAVLGRATDQLVALAEAYRKDVLIPLCTKHRLTYLVDMGGILFTTEDDVNVRSERDAADERLGDVLMPVLDVLTKECFGGNDVFGCYVRDIKKSDWLVGAKRRAGGA